MTPQERLKQIADASLIIHQEMLDRQVFRSCLNCDAWNEKTESCSLFNIKPPARVIVFSCGEQWLGEIPF